MSDNDTIQIGMRVEVRGTGEWRLGTVTAKRPTGKWEVKVDGWEKGYTWPEIRLPSGGEGPQLTKPTPPKSWPKATPIKATPIKAAGAVGSTSSVAPAVSKAASLNAAVPKMTSFGAYTRPCEVTYANGTGKRKAEGDAAADSDDDDGALLAPGVSQAFGGKGGGLDVRCWQGRKCKKKWCRFFHKDGREIDEAQDCGSTKPPADTVTAVSAMAMASEAGMVASPSECGGVDGSPVVTEDVGNPGLPQDPPTAEIKDDETLRAENDVLTSKVEVAELRAENAELKLRELERVYAALQEQELKQFGGAALPTLGQARGGGLMGAGRLATRARGRGRGGRQGSWLGRGASRADGDDSEDDICWSYKKGTCKLGNKCQWVHPR